MSAAMKPAMSPAVAIPIALLVGLVAAQAGARPARPRLCPGDAPEGVRLPPQPGCGSRAASVPRRDDGFREIVPGTGIRIGGRAAATFDGRR